MINNCEKIISIIVPVYNSEKYLHRCVDSIINQTYKNLEIILIDDGSSDNCPGICDEYEKKDSRVRAIHQENRGPMAACANGIKNATGEYIGFIDSDDWIERGMYYDMMNVAKNYNADLVQCGFIYDSDKESKEFLGINKDEVFKDNMVKDILIPKLLNFWDSEGLLFSPSRWNKLIKNDLVKKNLEYCDLSLKMGEDLNLILPILIDSKKVVCINKSYYHYVVNGNSTTQSFNANLWEKNKRLFKCIENICIEKKVKIQTNMNKYFIYMTILAIFNEYNSSDRFTKKVKNIINICKENPSKMFLNEYYSNNFNMLTRLVIRLMIIRLYFMVPIVFKFVEIIRNIKIYVQKKIHRIAESQEDKTKEANIREIK